VSDREFGTPPEDYRQHHTDVTHPNAGEREFETGKDEASFNALYNSFMAWFSNIKRTYDEYQHESLETLRHQRTSFDRVVSEQQTLFTKLLTDAQQHDNTRQNIANQALQNAVETANMVGKQAVRHGDLAIDRQWNIDEQTQATRAFDEHVAGGIHPHGDTD